MASFTLCFLQHHPLLCSTHGSLNDQAGTRHNLLCLDGDLLGQLASGRDDDGSDVVGFCALVAAGTLGEFGVVLENSLDNGDEETKRLAGSCLSLSDTAMR